MSFSPLGFPKEITGGSEPLGRQLKVLTSIIKQTVVQVLEVTLHIAIILEPFWEVPEVATNKNPQSAGGGVGFAGGNLHIIIGATFLRSPK